MGIGMARPSPSRRRCPLFLRLLVAAYWLAWSFRAPGQLYQLEALPAESPAPQAASSAPAASGSDAPAQNGATGATAAACDPCPPLSPSAVQPAAKAAGGASSDTQAPPEKKSDQPADADPPRLPRARWPTASEWLQLQAAESAARSKLPGNSFPDRPDWALRIGDPTPCPHSAYRHPLLPPAQPRSGTSPS
ncbi:protein of unknown function [Methylacidimicrobium sp. AP8]|nr:protein of unknown function [Methylacidimicrobium sp. AP8]